MAYYDQEYTKPSFLSGVGNVFGNMFSGVAEGGLYGAVGGALAGAAVGAFVVGVPLAVLGLAGASLTTIAWAAAPTAVIGAFCGQAFGLAGGAIGGAVGGVARGTEKNAHVRSKALAIETARGVHAERVNVAQQRDMAIIGAMGQETQANAFKAGYEQAMNQIFAAQAEHEGVASPEAQKTAKK